MDHFSYVLQGNADHFINVSYDDLLNERDFEGVDLLSRAVMVQNLNCVEVIYRRCPELLYCGTPKEHWNALHHAAARDDLEIIKFLIAADVESRGRGATRRLTRMLDVYDNSHLTTVIINNKSAEAAKLLIDADPSFNHPPNDRNQTPLKLCMSNSNMQDIFKLILESTPNESKTPMGPKRWTILHHAASSGDLSAIKDILRFCPDCAEVVDNRGQNFLHIAIQFNQEEVVRFCIAEKKPNVLNGQDNDGNTPLTIAASQDKLSVVLDIIDLCPDCFYLVDNKGMNFLHVAAMSKSIQVVRHVLGGKKIPYSVLNMQDSNGNTPLHLAALSGDVNLTLCFLYDDNVVKTTVNKVGQHVLQAVNFEYDKRKAGVHGIVGQLDQRDLKDQSDFDLVVGALIATVSFTAGITVPGGYITDKGTAVLSKRVGFEVFIMFNTFALLFSLYAVFSHYCTRRLIKTQDIVYQLKVATNCTLGAIYAMMAAFIAGSFTVLGNSPPLAISVSVVCSFFYIFSARPMWKLVMLEKDRSRGVQTGATAPTSRQRIGTP